jgi:hypothetical protein
MLDVVTMFDVALQHRGIALSFRQYDPPSIAATFSQVYTITKTTSATTKFVSLSPKPLHYLPLVSGSGVSWQSGMNDPRDHQ